MSSDRYLMNDSKHANLWKFATSKIEAGDEETAWKFFRRMFEKFEHHYRPFDPSTFMAFDRFAIILFYYFVFRYRIETP